MLWHDCMLHVPALCPQAMSLCWECTPRLRLPRLPQQQPQQ